MLLFYDGTAPAAVEWTISLLILPILPAILFAVQTALNVKRLRDRGRPRPTVSHRPRRRRPRKPSRALLHRGDLHPSPRILPSLRSRHSPTRRMDDHRTRNPTRPSTRQTRKTSQPNPKRHRTRDDESHLADRRRPRTTRSERARQRLKPRRRSLHLEASKPPRRSDETQPNPPRAPTRNQTPKGHPSQQHAPIRRRILR